MSEVCVFVVQSRKIGADEWETEFVNPDRRIVDAERRHLARNDRSRQFVVRPVETAVVA